MIETNKCNTEPCGIVKRLEKEQEDTKDWMLRIETKVDDALRQALLRPGWLTTAIISVLSSAVVGLLVSLANTHP